MSLCVLMEPIAIVGVLSFNAYGQIMLTGAGVNASYPSI